MSRIIGALALLLTATMASAVCVIGVSSCGVLAPEIDPESAAAGLTLLLGGLAIMQGRKKR